MVSIGGLCGFQYFTENIFNIQLFLKINSLHVQFDIQLLTYKIHAKKIKKMKKYTPLTPHQIRSIPTVLSGASITTVAKLWGVHIQTLNYWVKRHKEAGHKIKTKMGRPKFKI